MVNPAARSRGLAALAVLTAVSVPAATLPPYSERVSYYTYLVAFGLCMLLTVVAVRRIPAVQRGRGTCCC